MLVGLGVHPHLGQHRVGRRGVRGHQVLARHLAVPAAAQRLAVQSDVRPGHGADAPVEPSGQGRFELLGIEPAQGPGQGRRGRGLAASEPERVSQREPVLAPEPSDPLEARAPHQQGQRDQPEHRRQRVNQALQPARVRDR